MQIFTGSAEALNQSPFNGAVFMPQSIGGGAHKRCFVTPVSLTGPNFKTTSSTQMFPRRWIIWQSRLVPGIKAQRHPIRPRSWERTDVRKQDNQRTDV